MSNVASNYEGPTFRLLEYARLVRLPAVFSAPGNVMLGFWITHGDSNDSSATLLSTLVVASCCLYAAGMVWNDVWDVEKDRLERPNRPIPSGRISVQSAVQLGATLLVSGIAAAAFAGTTSLVIAVILTLFILLYDGLVKESSAGPPVMGLCRMFNVVLGMSPAIGESVASGSRLTLLTAFGPLALIPAGHAVFIAGVTLLSRSETTTSRRTSLVAAAMLMLVGLGMHTIVLAVAGKGDASVWLGWIVVLSLVLPPTVQAVRDAGAMAVQHAVKSAIIGLIPLDAALLLGLRGPLEAVYVLLLLVPAKTLGRWLYAT